MYSDSNKRKIIGNVFYFVSVGKEGLLTLVSAVGGKSPLRTLYVQGQNIKLAEPQMVEICSKLATSLGILVL